jgi:LacI family transcriptional regulator
LKRNSPASDKPPARTTVHDVARAAGVAIGTVSRVINGAPSVTPDVRQRVMAAIAELGWTPSVAAQGMRGVSARMVGFIFSDIRNPLYSAMVKGAEDVFSEHGYMLMVASSDGDPEREIALIDLFKRRRADGLIFSVEDESHAGVLRSLSDSRLPVVMLEREMPSPINGVGADHLDGTRRATEYLLALGHRRIALVTGGRGNRVARDRLKGLTQAHQRAGLEVDPRLLRLDSFSSDYAFRETQLLLSMEDPPTAIIALGIHHLRGVLSAIRLTGLSVPGDISLIAGNDSELAQLCTPAITVIRYDSYALGREAAQLLLRQISGEQAPDSVRLELPTEFVMRESCAPPGPPRSRR